ncbi:MAG: hypothetical protein ACRER2_07650 [Methylococcales bacterium]
MATQIDDNEYAGFNELSKAFKSNPTIENYVRLRRQNPGEVIEVAVSSGLEWLFSNEDTLNAVGIPPVLVGDILEADQAAVSELSLLLLEKIIERKRLEQEGQTHLASRGMAISDSLINFLICMILDSLDWNDHMVLPRDLIILLRERLGGENSIWEKEHEVKECRQKATWIAFQIAAEGKTPSYRSVGKILGVNATTVMRWFPDSTMIEAAKSIVPLVKKPSSSINSDEN